VVPWTVYGGYQLHRYRWVDDGWSSDMEHDVWDRDATVYPTKEAAQAALDALEGIP
jgi:hypothetical protein